MSILKRLAQNDNPASLAARLRRQRFEVFLRSVVGDVTVPQSILDVGGTETFWEVMDFADSPHLITLLNLQKIEVKHKNISSVQGNACSMMQFGNKSFDIVFSNSVIEHVGGINDQWRMAQEVRRVGRKYFVQTPNYYFPIEPHFLFPCFHWLPISFRVWLLRRYSLGWIPREQDMHRAHEIIRRIRLLKAAELQTIFPDATIWRERIFGLTKSIVAIKV